MSDRSKVPIKRLVFYFQESDSLIAYVDAQLRYFNDTTFTIRGFQLVLQDKNGDKIIKIIRPSIVLDTDRTLPAIGGSIIPLISNSIYNTYKIILEKCNGALPKMITWEASRKIENDEIYIGKALNKYGNENYYS